MTFFFCYVTDRLIGVHIALQVIQTTCLTLVRVHRKLAVKGFLGSLKTPENLIRVKNDKIHDGYANGDVWNNSVT